MRKLALARLKKLSDTLIHLPQSAELHGGEPITTGTVKTRAENFIGNYETPECELRSGACGQTHDVLLSKWAHECMIEVKPHMGI